MEMARSMGKVVDGVELVLNYMPEAGRFYGVTDPEALEWMQGRLTPQPWRTFEQNLRLVDEQAVRRIATDRRRLLEPMSAGGVSLEGAHESARTGCSRSRPGTT